MKKTGQGCKKINRDKWNQGRTGNRSVRDWNKNPRGKTY